MHQCDYCCWYVSDARGCECPWAMRAKACEEARNKANNATIVSKKKSDTQKSDSDESTVIERVEDGKIKEHTCQKCHKQYKSITTTDYNKAGMYISYSYCPDCGYKNLSSWHVW